jgi:hypothetical protein
VDAFLAQWNARYVLGVLLIAGIGLALWHHRYATARAAVERWASQHRYRVHRISLRLFGRPLFFKPVAFNSRDNDFFFRLLVDDMKLGGTGSVWVRCRVGWLGQVEPIDPDIDVMWDEMPRDDSPAAPELRWSDAQHALLTRVAAGETTFRRSGAGDADFDIVVEHLLALQRRGLLTCAAPIAEMRGGGQYAALTNVALTPEGEQAAARR